MIDAIIVVGWVAFVACVTVFFGGFFEREGGRDRESCRFKDGEFRQSHTGLCL